MLGASSVSPELQGPALCSPTSRAIVHFSTAMKAGAAQDSGIPLALSQGHCSLHFQHVKGSDHPRIWLVAWFCAPELYIVQQTEHLHRLMWGPLLKGAPQRGHWLEPGASQGLKAPIPPTILAGPLKTLFVDMGG